MSDLNNVAPQTLYSFPQLTNPDVYDVVVVGGGPAGLSAALVLGRCRRKVLVIDSGKPRNRFSKSMHGYLSRDGLSPAELKDISLEQLKPYTTVDVTDGTAIDAFKTDDCRFVVILEDDRRYLTRKLLIATGVSDEIPAIPGLMELYGTSVHHCPICDGYEWRDRGIAVYGKCDKGFGLVQEMTAWSRDLILCTDGPCTLTAEQLHYLETMRIGVNQKRIKRLEAINEKLQSIVFEDDSVVERDALFFCTGQSQQSDIGERLGCRLADKGCVWVGDHEQTSVEGVYCCGDASRNAQMVIVAAAEGAVAAVAINKALTMEYKEVKKAHAENTPLENPQPTAAGTGKNRNF